nr:hypothetical protein CFP56_78673 [Quercus suber]
MLVEEQVAGLEVSVYDVFGVEILGGSANLYDEPSDLGQRELLPFLDHVRQRSIGTELKHDICACGEGEGPVERDDVRMGEFRMDLKLRNKLCRESAT